MNRRRFLHALAAGAATAAAPRALAAAQPAGRAAARKPNVLLIFADDQGTLDVNCFGSKDLYTPHLDKLATRGLRFRQFYVGAPVCSPSRAALLTGRYPQRAGLPTNAGRSRGLPPSEVTIAETLKKAGYRTAIFGKWHLGLSLDLGPLAQGFDEFLGHRNGCIDNYSHFFYWSGPNLHDLWKGKAEHWEDGVFFPDIVVREATRFLEENKERPFFLYLPFNVPHYPEQGTPRFRKMYAKLKEPRRSYAAFVSTLDDRIGKVIAKVDELGIRDNTLIVFLSDHGYSTEQRANYGGGNAGPYRGHKFTLWEGGIRVPCIASMPGTLPEGEVREQLATSLDWYPTVAALCGAPLPKRTLDGASILPILKSPDAPPSHTTFHWQSGRGQWAVRDGHWKLVANGVGAKPHEKIFLSNMAKDATERKNIAKDHPDVVARLTDLHKQWVKDVQRK